MSMSVGLGRRTFLKAGAASAALIASPAFLRRAWAQEHKVIIAGPGGRTEVHQEYLRMLGYFKEFDVNVEFVNLADGSKILAAILSNSADCCMMAGIAPVFPAVDRGAKVKVIAGANMLPSYVMMTNDPNIKTMADLQGKTIATGSPGALIDELTTLLFRNKGLEKESAKFVNVGGTSEIFQALRGGIVQAGIGTVPVYLNREKYGLYAVEGGLAFDELPNYTAQGSFASDRAIDGNTEAMVRSMAAHCKSYRHLQNDPASKDMYAAAYMKVFPTADPAEPVSEWQYIQDKKPFAVDLVVSEARFDFIQKQNLEKGTQRRALKYEEVVNTSLAEAAVKMVEKS